MHGQPIIKTNVFVLTADFPFRSANTNKARLPLNHRF